MSRILVTGATGHLGQAVTRLLVKSGIPVLAVGRRAATLADIKKQIASPLLETAVVDLLKPAEISVAAAQFGPIRQLVHMAAQVDANAPLSGHLADNLIATVSLVGALRDSLEQIVNLSSIEVYGMPQTCPITEEQATAPVTYYGASKLAAEKFLNVFGLERGAAVTNLRCSSIYGPGETIRRATTVFLQNAVLGKPLSIAGDGSDLRDYIYVDDAAEAVLAALQAKKSGVYNLGGGAPLSIKDMAEIIIRMSGKALPLARGERTKPKYDLALNIAKIAADIGFHPKTSMESGLAAEYRTFVAGLRV